MRKRVAVTGIGLITPVGIGINETWSSICKGKSGIRKVEKIDSSGLKTKIAGEVTDFDPNLYMDKKLQKRSDPFLQFAVAASKMAVEDAEIEITSSNSYRIGVLLGTGFGGLQTLEKNHTILQERGPEKVSPFLIPMMLANMAPGIVAIELGLKGPNTCVVTACASSSHSIGEAYHLISRGDADVMITGGTEASITPLMISGFNSMGALSTRNDAPEKASRPFDRDRDGFVPGEGAGVLILEELSHALKRGARIYAEIIGYGLTGDAYHITAISPDGEGAVRCMKQAIEGASISPQDIDYINAHGTSTPLNDISETRAIKAVFGDNSLKFPVSSTKSMTGHLLGAAGGVEAIISILAINNNFVPPTINLENPDPECDLDYVPNKSREEKLNIVMSNSFGFGGTNATLIFKRFA
ncbi:MAG: beta-ketoacyl-ACP synthase II [Thermodesulfobacteriota bacterium]|nr:beta-ketoacyl-ACP synthase II [Thermodesulfobacteriota bacterium]